MAGAEAKTRSSIAGLRFLSLLAALAPAPAIAGAWIAPEGGQEIWTNVAGERAEAMYFETSGYWEAPLGRRLAVVAAPWLEQAYDAGEEGWRAEATLALKLALLRGEAGAMAVQAGAVWTSLPAHRCGETGAELRWLGGLSVGRASFVNLEAAARRGENGCGGERAELSAGYRANENWLAMGQIFLDAPDEGETTLKAQFTLVRFGEEGRGVQFGVRTRIDGGPAEPALVLGFWGQPGE